MEDMEYFFELYDKLPRGGPGDNRSTKHAFQFMTELPEKPLILDIACGPGMQTLELASLSRGFIAAIDNHQPFLNALSKSAREKGLGKNSTAIYMSMLEMNFQRETFDAIWSEGALYFMGF
ncbi:MAG: class I SAM-dependent methyltransferase [Spirochaetes bacterium]|jgi:ubiquinone/menaquinone biosynthesis C-methylase UbiE|nr:class I SAM-dependent methyltransferase [Spirochaetota bacterium]